jgi:nucleotide-binding universal stress UspA family protein
MKTRALAHPARLEKLLVCTDNSPESQGALAAALELARLAGSRVFLLEVLVMATGYEFQPQELMPTPPQMELELMALREAAVKKRLEDWQAQASAGGLEVEVRVRLSVAAYTGILEEAEAVQPDLIIMGRHGLTGLSRLLLGSVTARVIGHSAVNVLVVPKEAALGFKRILVASDGSPYSDKAFKEALSITQRMGSHLIGLAAAATDVELKTATEVARRLQDEANQRGVALETAVPQGQPFEAIVRVARAKKANLIILGSHGRTGLKKLLLGSTVERVIGQAPCAVLVVKKP